MRRTILLVDDNLKEYDEIINALFKEGFKVICCDNAESALSTLKKNDIDIILLDFVLPKMNGIKFLNIIRNDNVNIPVIMYTSINHYLFQKECLSLGISDFVVKPCYSGLLLKKINFILNSQNPIYNLTNNVWTHNDLKIDFSSKIAMLNNEVINLSKTELEILKLFIKSEGIVLTREQILNSIWGSSQVVSDRTIDAHICKIRKKLNLTCLKSASGYGYVLKSKEI